MERIRGWVKRTPYDPETDPSIAYLRAKREESEREIARLKSEYEPTGHFWSDRLRGIDPEDQWEGRQ
jgi:hypothetical protein